MNQRAERLIKTLGLAPHPEGGWFREIHRSRHRVTTGEGPRSSVTHIYYLLIAGQHGRWHRIDADEIWHFYEGTGLTLLTLAPRSRSVTTTKLGNPARGCRPVAVVDANCWQAATVERGFALVGCSVAPGFTFDRFELLADNPRARTKLTPLLGRHAGLV